MAFPRSDAARSSRMAPFCEVVATSAAVGRLLPRLGGGGNERRELRLVVVAWAAAASRLHEEACRWQARQCDALACEVRLVGVSGSPRQAADPVLGCSRGRRVER